MKVTNWFLNFDFAGRARRSHWWANAFAWAGVWLMLFLAVMMVTFAGKSSGATAAAGVIVAIGFVAAIMGLIDGMAMTFRRAHDTGKSGWIWLLLLIPVVNLMPFYWLMIEDSQQGPNKYGPPVKDFYQPGIAAA